LTARAKRYGGGHTVRRSRRLVLKETLALTPQQRIQQPQQRIQQNDRVLRMIEELRDGLAKSGKPALDPGVERR